MDKNTYERHIKFKRKYWSKKAEDLCYTFLKCNVASYAYQNGLEKSKKARNGYGIGLKRNGVEFIYDVNDNLYKNVLYGGNYEFGKIVERNRPDIVLNTWYNNLVSKRFSEVKCGWTISEDSWWSLREWNKFGNVKIFFVIANNNDKSVTKFSDIEHVDIRCCDYNKLEATKKKYRGVYYEINPSCTKRFFLIEDKEFFQGCFFNIVYPFFNGEIDFYEGIRNIIKQKNNKSYLKVIK